MTRDGYVFIIRIRGPPVNSQWTCGERRTRLSPSSDGPVAQSVEHQGLHRETPVRFGSTKLLVFFGLSFGPTRLNGFTCACAALFSRHLGGSSRTAFLAAFATEGNRRRILFLCGHDFSIRDRFRKINP